MTISVEGDHVVIGMGAGRDQLGDARIAVRPEHVRRERGRDGQLAQTRRPAEQQRMADAFAVERAARVLEHALLPRRETGGAHATRASRSTRTASAATTSAGRVASRTRKRVGACCARAR